MEFPHQRQFVVGGGVPPVDFYSVCVSALAPVELSLNWPSARVQEATSEMDPGCECRASARAKKRVIGQIIYLNE